MMSLQGVKLVFLLVIDLVVAARLRAVEAELLSIIRRMTKDIEKSIHTAKRG